MFKKLAIVASVVALAACGQPQVYPLTVDSPAGEVTIHDRPEAIISLSPTATEMLFAIGAGPQVVAVDDQSDFPPGAPVTDFSGLTPNLEAISTFQPDLVIVSYDPGDLVSGLGALGIPVLILPAAVTLDDVYGQLETLGAVTGGDSEAIVRSMRADIAEIVAGASRSGLTYYHELDPTLYSVASSTFIGHLYSLLGMKSIADPADTDGYGYPQLSAEYIIESDPDVIVLADTLCCDVSSASVASRPGWGAMTAVANGSVIEADDSVASRWGPRVVDFLRLIAASRP